MKQEFGISLGNVTEVSTGLPAISIFIGAFDNNGTTQNFLIGTASTFIAGAAIGFNQSAHNTNIRALLTTLGVLP